MIVEQGLKREQVFFILHKLMFNHIYTVEHSTHIKIKDQEQYLGIFNFEFIKFFHKNLVSLLYTYD